MTTVAMMLICIAMMFSSVGSSTGNTDLTFVGIVISVIALILCIAGIFKRKK